MELVRDMESVRDKDRISYEELKQTEPIKAHPIFMLRLLELTFQKISRYKFMYKADNYILTAEYDKEKNEFFFEKVYNGSVSDILDNITKEH